ncbi:MAG: hypothetical protein HY295_06475 [Thaumarchaeota archaeon]|nr:hypothetical protein [Nitrososphaerota archaeon]
MFKEFFNTIVINYSCKGGAEDRKELEHLQKLIEERVTQLGKLQLDSYSDPTLLNYYDLYAKIQNCIFEDHSLQYILISIIIPAIAIIVFIRWWILRKKK